MFVNNEHKKIIRKKLNTEIDILIKDFFIDGKTKEKEKENYEDLYEKSIIKKKTLFKMD